MDSVSSQLRAGTQGRAVVQPHWGSKAEEGVKVRVDGAWLEVTLQAPFYSGCLRESGLVGKHESRHAMTFSKVLSNGLEGESHHPQT